MCVCTHIYYQKKEEDMPDIHMLSNWQSMRKYLWSLL